jgi:ATP-dependent RNA helicase DeaD
LKSFDELRLSEPLARAVRDLGFTVPTPIQQQALPLLLAGPTDFIGLAATGTGKTAAFGLPLLEGVDASDPRTQALVLCPTRELALQVAGQLDLLGKHKGVKAVPIYGGTGYADQLAALRGGARVVVGTPGRVVDHLDRGSLSLKDARVVALDEADEMISMGFKEDLEKILGALPKPGSHIWLFSATMSPAVRKVADAYLRKPKHAQVNKTEMLSGTVEQTYFVVREHEKPEVLRRLIDLTDDFYGLVFCQTKALVMDLTQYLQNHGYKVDCLHGDKSQEERERSMRSFRERKTRLMICTDVASRGLDVKDLTHVINYSIPRELELYVHRIGRTARSGKSGHAISLVAPSHRYLINRIEHMTKSRLTEGKLPGRREVALKKLARIRERFEAQNDFKRAADMLGPDWERAAGGMPLGEVIARFLFLLSPDLFNAPAPEKPLSESHPVQHPKPAHHAKPHHHAKPGHHGKPHHKPHHGKPHHKKR